MRSPVTVSGAGARLISTRQNAFWFVQSCRHSFILKFAVPPRRDELHESHYPFITVPRPRKRGTPNKMMLRRLAGSVLISKCSVGFVSRQKRSPSAHYTKLRHCHPPSRLTFPAHPGKAELVSRAVPSLYASWRASIPAFSALREGE